MADHEDEVEELPPVEKLLLEDGLYYSYSLRGDWSYVKRIVSGLPLQLDTYCVYCERMSTFRDQRARGGGAGMRTPNDESYLNDRLLSVELTCQRNPKHDYFYLLEVKRQELRKIGQTPSLADIAGPELARFASVLDSRYLNDLKRASGLFAHGVGTGSFVYLRRVFEKLIHDELDAARRENDPAVADLTSNHLEDKIDALRHRLPASLVKFKAAYGVLSAGIHELDEETCRRYFPIVKGIIFVILEEHLQARAKKLREEQLERDFNKATQEVVQRGKTKPKP